MATTLDMIVEAIQKTDDRKGASVYNIKSFIASKCPDRKPELIKTLMRKAISKGMDDGVLIRPQASANMGKSLTGHFKVNKEKVDEKPTSKKEKKAPAKETKAKSEAKSSAAATKKPTKNAAAKKKSPAKKRRA